MALRKEVANFANRHLDNVLKQEGFRKILEKTGRFSRDLLLTGAGKDLEDHGNYSLGMG